MTTITEGFTELGIDLTAEVPCQSAVTACYQPATWLGFAPCCESRRTLCDEHRQRVIDREQAATRIHGRDRIRCNVCGTRPMPEVTWRPL